jgi:hypothetical protein
LSEGVSLKFAGWRYICCCCLYFILRQKLTAQADDTRSWGGGTSPPPPPSRKCIASRFSINHIRPSGRAGASRRPGWRGAGQLFRAKQRPARVHHSGTRGAAAPGGPQVPRPRRTKGDTDNQRARDGLSRGRGTRGRMPKLGLRRGIQWVGDRMVSRGPGGGGREEGRWCLAGPGRRGQVLISARGRGGRDPPVGRLVQYLLQASRGSRAMIRGSTRAHSLSLSLLLPSILLHRLTTGNTNRTNGRPTPYTPRAPPVAPSLHVTGGNRGSVNAGSRDGMILSGQAGSRTISGG